ncbi:MAG: TadE/TadG family type IV pilus assembly protein [Vicinamibacterales bacterium]
MARVIPAALVRSERGAELVEMALVTPILLLLVMGIVDFGFLFQRYVVLTNAAVEGARVASLPGYTAADAEARVQEYATAGGVPGAVTAVATPVTLPGAGGGTWPGMQMTVTHVYTLQYITPLVTLVGGSTAASITLTARSTMRRQVAAAP